MHDYQGEMVLVILAWAFTALGVLLFGLGARQAARWRPGGSSTLPHEHLPRLGSDRVTAPSHRAPFRHGGVSVSGRMRWGTTRVFLVTDKQECRGASARWTVKGTYHGDQISLAVEGERP